MTTPVRSAGAPSVAATAEGLAVADARPDVERSNVRRTSEHSGYGGRWLTRNQASTPSRPCHLANTAPTLSTGTVSGSPAVAWAAAIRSASART